MPNLKALNAETTIPTSDIVPTLHYAPLHNQSIVNSNMSYNTLGNSCLYDPCAVPLNNNWTNQFSNSVINENSLDEKKSLQKCIKNVPIVQKDHKKINIIPLINIENNAKIANLLYESNVSMPNSLTSTTMHNPSTSATAMFAPSVEDNIMLNNHLQNVAQDRTFICEWMAVS